MQAIYFDVIRNYLKYCGYRVTYVRNYTDVDDKIIQRASERGISPLKLSADMIASSIEDMKALGVAPADMEPKVSEHIPEIIAMVQEIIAKGFAYATKDGDVYFRVRKKLDYGKLSNRKPDDMRSGSRAITSGDKEDELDFALWKADSSSEATWDSPWGRGRPGWHIECSAMACKHLGKSFEIHGGGRDLVFPHHENEIAQSEAANSAPYATHWIHSGLLTINHQKMSKSLGNHITIKKFLEKWPPEVLRLGFLANHYQSNIDFSLAVFQTCMKRLLYYYEGFTALEKYSDQVTSDLDQRLIEEFHEAMSDDFNTASAIGVLNKNFKLAREMTTQKKSPDKQKKAAAMAASLRSVGQVLGLFKAEPAVEIVRLKRLLLVDLNVTEAEVNAAMEQRQNARKSKDFATSDRIRDEMSAKGIELRDTPEGPAWGIRLTDEV
jgi:cysteinyl-tRNA synthetase